MEHEPNLALVGQPSAIAATSSDKAYKFRWKSSKSNLWLHGDTMIEAFNNKSFKSEKSLKSHQKKFYEALKKNLGAGTEGYEHAMMSLKRYKSEKGLATAWKYVKRLCMPHFNERGTLCTHICILCDADPDCSWDDALIAVFHKGNKNGEPIARSGAGPNAHLQTHHKAIFNQGIASFKELVGSKRKSTELQSAVSKRKNLKSMNVHMALVDVMIECQLPFSIAEHPSIERLMEITTKQRYCKLWRGRADRILDIKYARTLQTVQQLVREAKIYYEMTLKKDEIPSFVTCTYDKSSLDDGIAISISFISPNNFKLHRVAVGLPLPPFKTQAQVEATVVAYLDKLGIKFDMVKLVEAPELTPGYVPFTYAQGASEERGLHILTHLVEKAFSEEFTLGQALVDKAKSMFDYMLDASQPEKWQEFVSINKEIKVDVGALKPLDEKAGLFGIYDFLCEVLKGYHCWKNYFAHQARAVTKKDLEPNEWKAVAEIEAMLRPIVQLAREIDRDMIVTPGIAWFFVKRAKVLCSAKDFKTIDFAEEHQWGMTTDFDKLPFVQQLVETDVAHQLQDCLTNFEEYLPKETTESLIAMVCDPIVNTVGRSWMKSDEEDSAVFEKAIDAFTKEFYMEAEKGIEKHGEVPVPEPPIEPPGPTVAGSSDWDGRSRQAVNDAIEMNQQEGMPEEELNRWMNLKENWLAVFKSQHPRNANSPAFNATYEELNKKLGDPLFVASKCDVLQWWNTMKKEFPIISRMASKFLSRMPETGYEEKVFVSRSENDFGNYRNWFGGVRFEYFKIMHFNAKWARHNLIMGDVVRDIQNDTKLAEILNVLETFSFSPVVGEDTIHRQIFEFCKDITVPDEPDLIDEEVSNAKKKKGK